MLDRMSDYTTIKDRKTPLKGSRPSVPHGINFLQVVLVDEIPLSSCTVYRYLCGIFLNDISTREQFAFLVYCYRVKAIFHNLWPNKQVQSHNLWPNK